MPRKMSSTKNRNGRSRCAYSYTAYTRSQQQSSRNKKKQRRGTLSRRGKRCAPLKQPCSRRRRERRGQGTVRRRTRQVSRGGSEEDDIEKLLQTCVIGAPMPVNRRQDQGQYTVRFGRTTHDVDMYFGDSSIILKKGGVDFQTFKTFSFETIYFVP